MRNVMYEKVAYHHSNFYNEITEFDVETLLDSRERERERRRLDITKGKTIVV